jgi:hypothetical protein
MTKNVKVWIAQRGASKIGSTVEAISTRIQPTAAYATATLTTLRRLSSFQIEAMVSPMLRSKL